MTTLLAGPASAAGGPPADSAPDSTRDNAEPAARHGSSDAVDLDVLYIGAHPDDEAGSLAAFGQWNEFHDIEAGVITVTRGEGGGNAVGLEEGPDLGLLREAEERRAVANAGIENIYNLDKVDYYYTASAPLTTQAWGEDTLERVVRVIRTTKPEVIVTMNPSPTPGNHGHHQEAARMAVQAYQAAADPERFTEQLTEEGLSPWRVARILRGGASGQGVTGSACETTAYTPNDTTDRVFGVWQGRLSDETGETWALRERKSQWEYVSQGWAVFPPPPTDPEQNGCDWFTLIDSRTPYPATTGSGITALQGALLPVDGGLPLGTELDIAADQFLVRPGESFGATVQVRAGSTPLARPQLAVTAPDGWTVEPTESLPRTIQPGRSATVDVVVTPPADAALGDRVALAATLSAGGGSGSNEVAVETAPAVRGELAQRPEARVFAEWAFTQNVPKLESLISPIASLGTSRTQPVTIDVVNDGDEPASGTVALELDEGFTASPASQAFDALPPGEATSVTFEVTNVDSTLPTANRATNGGYPFRIVTSTADGEPYTQDAVLELVPTTEIPLVEAAPTVDGVAGADEYPGEVIDTSTVWEGQAVTPEDASATTRVSFTDEALYVAVEVTDDTLGTVLPPEDCKRHWRTDSVEITVDPRGTSSNTSTTFKTGIFPITDDPDAGNPACFQRDADNFQGPGPETAPGMEVASTVGEPYGGYTVEAKIPFSVLPDAVDPARMGLNVLVYDSDTQDKTGQSRLGWSTFNGVQADPFRWALATLPGLAEAPSAPVAPRLPSDVALSVQSPQSIAQSAVDGVPLGGGAGLSERSARLGSVVVDGDEVAVRLTSRIDGTANLYVRQNGEVVGSLLGAEVESGTQTIRVPVSEVTGDVEVLAAVITEKGTLALRR